MQCAPKRSSDFHKVSDKGKELLEVRLQEDDCSTINKDSVVSSFAWTDYFDYRCAVISFLTVESDGLGGIVAQPLQYLDSLHVSFLPQMNQFIDERKLVQNGSASNGTYPINSFRCKAIKSSNKPSSKLSWRRSCSSSALMSSDSSAISGIPIGGAKIHRYGKKNPRKKTKKKEIEFKKTTDFVSAETAAVSSGDSALGSLLPEACDLNDLDLRNGSVLCSTALDTFLPDFRISKNDFEPDSVSSDIVEGGTHFDRGVETKDGLSVGCCNEFCSKDSFENNPPDSKCASSNSDSDCLNLKLNEKEGFGIDLLKEQSSSSREKCCSHLNSIRDEVDANAESEKANNGTQGCSLSETRSALPGKKTKQNKKLIGSSRMNRIGGLGSSQRRTGKENSHTVWQKVEKNNSGGCCAQLDREIPVTKQFKGICNPVVVQLPKVKEKKTGNKKQPKDKSRRLKRNNTSEQEKIYRPSKSSSSSNASSMVHKPPNGSLDIPSKGFDIRSSCASSACFQNDSTDKCTTFQSFESTPVCLDGLMSDEFISDGLNGRGVENESSSLPGSCNPLNLSNLLKVQPPVYLPHLFFQATKEITLAERGKHDNQSRPTLRNWVLRGAESSGLATVAKSDFSNLKDADKQPAEVGTSEKSIQDVNCNLLDPVSVINNGLQHSRDGSHDPLEDEREAQKTAGHDTDTLQHQKCQLAVDEHLNCKSSCEDASTSRMQHVVSNAFKAQLASEAFQMKTGCPIAEFERFLHFSSPVISQRPNLISCEICPRNQLGDVIPCSHETANISLGSLWQWYEKHGCYGLEIKANDHENLNGYCADNSEFRAYFVPFLSAVQLFKNNKSRSRTTTGPVGLGSCARNIKVKEHSTCHPSLFSILFPKPCISDASVRQVCSQLHSSEQPLASEKREYSEQPVDFKLSGESELIFEQPLASEKREYSEQPVDFKLSGESELIFEYFEGQQPQQRGPIINKIHQLVDGRVQGKLYGDPTILNSITLNDLDAESWYSVAWYPIYRIPSGNFQAAFLTYHSLGHFVRRTSQLNSRDTDSCLVCPVVGLQSYNAQNECWFEPRNGMSSTSTPGLNPQILDERLRSLEETASLMARAVVKKGNLNSENRHPDYEFFLSRRR